MIDIKDKKDCCGCNVCGDICNQGAISFKTDEEGFWYPVVDTVLCTDCHLCERVCPILNLEKAKKHGQQYPKVYGGFHKNVTICKPQKKKSHFGKKEIPQKCDKLYFILTFLPHI